MAQETIATMRLPLTGEAVTSPVLHAAPGVEYRVAVEGLAEFRAVPGSSGEVFDACFWAGPSGAFDQRHTLLRWGVEEVRVASEDRARHRYVFRVVPAEGSSPASLTVALDVDQLVSRYLMPPSQVRHGLTGELRVTVLRSVPPPALSTLLLVPAVPTGLLLAGVGWAVRRRARWMGLDTDARAVLERIAHHEIRARAGLRRLPQGLRGAVGSRLRELGEGARRVVIRLRELRQAAAHVDRGCLERELAFLRPAVERSAVAVSTEASAAMEQKLLTLRYLDALEADEAQAWMRLTRIEALFESTVLALRRASADGPDQESALCGALAAEVQAIGEVVSRPISLPRAAESGSRPASAAMGG
jgi:hypothetical protein